MDNYRRVGAAHFDIDSACMESGFDHTSVVSSCLDSIFYRVTVTPTPVQLVHGAVLAMIHMLS